MPSRSNWNSAGRIGRGSCGTIEVNRSRSTSIWASSLWMQTMVFGVRRSSSARMWSMCPCVSRIRRSDASCSNSAFLMTSKSPPGSMTAAARLARCLRM